MWALFNRFEIKMTLQQAESCSHPGDCEHDVRMLMEHPRIKRQRKRIDPELIRQELSEYGAWSDEELADDDRNWLRILWIGANDITEEAFMKRSWRMTTVIGCASSGRGPAISSRSRGASKNEHTATYPIADVLRRPSSGSGDE